jgi:hypothetical protein
MEKPMPLIAYPVEPEKLYEIRNREAVVYTMRRIGTLGPWGIFDTNGKEIMRHDYRRVIYEKFGITNPEDAWLLSVLLHFCRISDQRGVGTVSMSPPEWITVLVPPPPGTMIAEPPPGVVIVW